MRAGSSEKWRLGRRPALDGLRGLAILLVLVGHLGLAGFFAPGEVGVTVFFTLSGFLITSLLLEEQERTGHISLRAFFARRARRLLPALTVFLVVMLVAGAALGPVASTPVSALIAVSYVGNWFCATGYHLQALTHTWSLAIEEQFYVVWPIVVLACLRLRRFPALLGWCAGAGALASIANRFVDWNGGRGQTWIYYATNDRADALLIGALVAVVMSRQRVGSPWPKLATGCVLVIAPLCMLTGFTFAVLGPTIAALLTAGTIVAVVRGNYGGWLETPALVEIGRRSYALYLWNFPLLELGTLYLPFSPGVSIVVSLAAAFGLTWLSWHYVESPFMRGRPTRSARATAIPATILRGGSELQSENG